MRYVIYDMDGAARGHFSSPSEVLQVIDEVRRDDPEMVEELHVLRYDDEGAPVGHPIPVVSLLPQDVVTLGAAFTVSSSGVARPYEDTLQPA